MATLTDKLKITIQVADLPGFIMTINREEEETYREIVKELNKVWQDLKTKRPDMATQNIMAIAAIKYAKRMHDAIGAINQLKADDANRQDEINNTLDEFEKGIDKILLSVSEE